MGIFLSFFWDENVISCTGTVISDFRQWRWNLAYGYWDFPDSLNSKSITCAEISKGCHGGQNARLSQTLYSVLYKSRDLVSLVLQGSFSVLRFYLVDCCSPLYSLDIILSHRHIEIVFEYLN